MKTEYDFSQEEQGKFYVPTESIQLPIYLEPDIQHTLSRMIKDQPIESLLALVNKLLRKDIELLDTLRTV
jgi:hypothetical protein